jgi:hypothetical protein
VAAVVGGDPATALAEVDAGLALVPGDGILRFIRSGALAASGELDRSRAEAQALVPERPGWEIVIRSFTAKGLMPMELL